MRRPLNTLLTLTLTTILGIAQAAEPQRTAAKTSPTVSTRFDATTFRKAVKEDNFQELVQTFKKYWTPIYRYTSQSGSTHHQHIVDCADIAITKPGGGCDFADLFYSELEYEKYYQFQIALRMEGPKTRIEMREQVFMFYCAFYTWCAKNPIGAKYVKQVNDFEGEFYHWITVQNAINTAPIKY